MSEQQYAAQPIAQPYERVGRGLAFAFAGAMVGVIAAGALGYINIFASITSFLTAWLATIGYAKGAGAPPRKGAAGLILVIIAGIVLAFLAMEYFAVMKELRDYHGYTGAVFPVFLDVMRDPQTWRDVLFRDLAIFVLFGALGSFGTIRAIMRARDPQAVQQYPQQPYPGQQYADQPDAGPWHQAPPSGQAQPYQQGAQQVPPSQNAGQWSGQQGQWSPGPDAQQPRQGDWSPDSDARQGPPPGSNYPPNAGEFDPRPPERG